MPAGNSEGRRHDRSKLRNAVPDRTRATCSAWQVMLNPSQRAVCAAANQPDSAKPAEVGRVRIKGNSSLSSLGLSRSRMTSTLGHRATSKALRGGRSRSHRPQRRLGGRRFCASSWPLAVALRGRLCWISTRRSRRDGEPVHRVQGRCEDQPVQSRRAQRRRALRRSDPLDGSDPGDPVTLQAWAPWRRLGAAARRPAAGRTHAGTHG